MRKTFRRGFTLPEVLVTVTIVAVLAAVMVPAVINQVSKGDIPAVGSDLGAIRTAITTFAADTRRFPGRLSDLGETILDGDSTDISAAVYRGDSANYHGPYLTVGQGHTGPTGAVFANAFFVPAGTSSICLKDSVDVAPTPDVSLISKTQIVQMDEALDGGDGRTTGSIRWTETVPGTIDFGTARVCLTTK